MLKHCSNLILYVADQKFIELCKDTVSYRDTVVMVNPEEVGDRILNKTTVTIIAQSAHVSCIPGMVLTKKKDRVWILLEDTDDVEALMNNGYTNFIFNKEDDREILACTRYKSGFEVNSCSNEEWSCGAYKFNFAYNIYKWGDRRVHIRPAEGKHLHEYLVLGKRSQATRQTMYNIRKRIGEEFLREFTKNV